MLSSIPSVFLFCHITLVTASTRPHIIFILADDLGWSDVGYHGSIIKTPNIDRLAAEGVKLENYYVAYQCSPSRSLLMTGRYMTHTGLQHLAIAMMQPSCLPLDEVTLPQKLQQYGYSTHMVGKWHLGFYKKECLPNYRGFQSFLGFYQPLEDYFYHNISTDDYRGWDFRRNDDVVAEQYSGQYSTHVFTEEAQHIITNHDNSQPLFLYLSFQAVHTPLQVPSRYSDLYKDLIPDNEERRIYAGMTTCMDEAIGNVTRTLQQTGLWENTVLIFSTDNGGVTWLGTNWPLRGGKTSLYEGGIRAVGFVNSPLLGDHVRGTATKELIHMSDWFPTLVRLAGGTLIGNKKLDGYNQWETISQGAPTVRNEILLNIDPLYKSPSINKINGEKWADNQHFNISIRAGIRAGEWKLMTGSAGNGSWVPPLESTTKAIHPERSSTKVIQLFNIVSDPYERYNRAEEQPAVVEALLKKLSYYYKDSVPTNFPEQNLHDADPKYHGGAWSPWE
ncbi:arylsulfatase I-like [Glandiceps talaboti]